MPDLSYLVGPDLGNETVGKSRSYDPPAYLDSSIRETIRQFQEYQERQKSQRESIFDLFSNQKSPLESHFNDFEIFSNDVVRMAHEIAVEPPSAIQRRIIIDKLSENNSELSEQNELLKIQNAQQKEEIELLKKQLGHLGILPSMGTNVEKIATQTESPQIIPDYIPDLIRDLELTKDLKIMKSLESVARYLIDVIGFEDLDPHLLLQFKNKDGSEIPMNSAQQAVKRAKRNDKQGTN